MNVIDYFAKDLLKGQVATITGGGSGINLGVAHSLAALGADIAICGRTESKLLAAAETIKEHQVDVFTYPADVRNAESMKSFFSQSEQTLGPASVLVCGAAGNFLAPAHQLSANGFKSVIDIDLIGSFNSSLAAFPQLKATKGSLIFISAGQAYTPYAYQVHAGAAKAGIDQMMKNLALEWGPYGINVNSVVPGPIKDTAGLEKLSNLKELDRFVQNIPLQRLGIKQDIGALIAFLASPMASYITGSRLDCDGGQNLVGSALLNHSVKKMLNQAKNFDQDKCS